MLSKVMLNWERWLECNRTWGRLLILCEQIEVSAGRDSDVWQKERDLRAHRTNGLIAENGLQWGRGAACNWQLCMTRFTASAEIKWCTQLNTRDKTTRHPITSPMCWTFSLHCGAARKSDQGDFISMWDCILATPLKSTSLCSGLGLLWPAMKLCKHITLLLREGGRPVFILAT